MVKTTTTIKEGEKLKKKEEKKEITVVTTKNSPHQQFNLCNFQYDVKFIQNNAENMCATCEWCCEKYAYNHYDRKYHYIKEFKGLCSKSCIRKYITKRILMLFIDDKLMVDWSKNLLNIFHFKCKNCRCGYPLEDLIKKFDNTQSSGLLYIKNIIVDFDCNRITCLKCDKERTVCK